MFQREEPRGGRRKGVLILVRKMDPLQYPSDYNWKNNKTGSLLKQRQDKTSIKGVAERSSVFASEIFTAISQISEEPPEVIHINEMP